MELWKRRQLKAFKLANAESSQGIMGAADSGSDGSVNERCIRQHDLQSLYGNVCLHDRDKCGSARKSFLKKQLLYGFQIKVLS